MMDNVTPINKNQVAAAGELPEIKFDINLFAGHGRQLIDRERVKQLQHGFTVEHDERCHTVDELARIAVCYMDFAVNQIEGVDQDEPHTFWPPFTAIPWKPKDEPYETFVMGAAFAEAALDLAIGLARREEQVDLPEGGA